MDSYPFYTDLLHRGIHLDPRGMYEGILEVLSLAVVMPVVLFAVLCKLLSRKMRLDYYR